MPAFGLMALSCSPPTPPSLFDFCEIGTSSLITLVAASTAVRRKLSSAVELFVAMSRGSGSGRGGGGSSHCGGGGGRSVGVVGDVEACLVSPPISCRKSFARPNCRASLHCLCLCADALLAGRRALMPASHQKHGGS